MKNVIYFILVSLLTFTSCKKDGSNPVNADTVPIPPTLATPKDTSANIAVPVVLTWNESSGTKSYTLQVSASSSFSSFVFNKNDITTATQQIPELNYLAVYYWRVSASNSVGTSDWSKVWSFTTTGDAPAFVPQLSLPTNGAVEQKLSPVLVWNKVSNANSYTLQISTNSSFTNFVFNTDSLTVTSKQATNLSGLTQYYWRVSATNNFGSMGWSETWSFTTGIAPVPPVLLSPTDGATDISLSPTLTWNGSSGATSYVLQLSTNNSFSSFVFNQSVTTTNKQITGLTNSTKYYWRVSTKNNFGTSNPSDVWSFTIGTPPTAPTLLTPSDGATEVALSPSFTWNASTGATSYTLQVATDNSFTNTIFNNNVGNITSKQITDLSGLTKYYWRVNATNTYGSSAASTSWSFTTKALVCGSQLIYAEKTYNIVMIGNQCWLKENLDVGTMISDSTNQTNNSIIEKYCYDNNSSNCATYGGLYQWNEAMQYSIAPGIKGICPTGWHIPTFVELQVLRSVFSSGNALKEVGQGSGSGAGTNTSGFSALLAGFRYSGGYFYSLGYYSYFWSSTEYDATNASNFYLYYDDSSSHLSYSSKESGFSVRCLKDK
ncbi:MAG: FISUMP domain-containing protein [Ignavibacteriaceae bacterium]|jgi:uncharacterized protein (TIGR02145 family)